MSPHTLLRCWREAQSGEGRAVLLSGEAGIGKSRLVLALRQHISDRGFTTLNYHGSPYHQGSSLYPIVAAVEAAAGFLPGDGSAAKLEKLEAFLSQSGHDPRESAPLYASLPAIPTESRYPPLNLGPQQQKRRTLDLLDRHLADITAKGPVLMVVEDLHWIDPSTLEVIDRLMTRVGDASHSPGHDAPPGVRIALDGRRLHDNSVSAPIVALQQRAAQSRRGARHRPRVRSAAARNWICRPSSARR